MSIRSPRFERSSAYVESRTIMFNVIGVWEHSDSLGPLDAITAVGRKSSQIGSGSLSAADRENDGIPCFRCAKGASGFLAFGS